MVVDKSTTSQEHEFTRLSYVEVLINGKIIMEMIDSEETHNFMKKEVAKELGPELGLELDPLQNNKTPSRQ